MVQIMEKIQMIVNRKSRKQINVQAQTKIKRTEVIYKKY